MPSGRRIMGRYAGGGEGALCGSDGYRMTPPFAVWRLAINGISPSWPCPRPGIRAGRPGSATLLVPGGFIHVFVISRRGRPSWSPASNVGGMGDLPSNRSRRHILNQSANAASTVSMTLTGSMNIHPSIGIRRNSSSLWCCRCGCWCGTRWGFPPSGSVAFTRPPSCGGPCPGTRCWIRCRPGHSCPAH